ncbi:MAG: hypothetical protein K2G96_01185, partial [Clostridia bacterium]|nr:hypothetical protein [Clostridia bacterium]
MTDNIKASADEKLIEEVTEDFLRLQRERRLIERGWQLNINFVSGKQYCDIDSSGEIYEEDKKYFWQTRRVFNHIAPIVDMRCSKLGGIRPSLTVRAASDEEGDKHSASLASAILSSVSEAEDLDGIISEATCWSETCGTSFYKIMWDGCAGSAVGKTGDGKSVKQGDGKVCAVSPFEIYPYSLSEEKLENQRG